MHGVPHNPVDNHLPSGARIDYLLPFAGPIEEKELGSVDTKTTGPHGQTSLNNWRWTFKIEGSTLDKLLAARPFTI